jgi:hypothetical protein
MLAAKARTLPEKIEPTGFVRYSSVRYSYLFLTAAFLKKGYTHAQTSRLVLFSRWLNYLH